MSLHKKLPHSKATPCMCCLNRFWACKRELALRHLTIAMRQVNTIINTQTHAHAHTHTHMYTHIHTHVHVQTHTHTRTHTCVQFQVDPQFFKSTLKFTFIPQLWMGYTMALRILTHTHTHTHTLTHHLHVLTGLHSIRINRAHSMSVVQCFWPR